MALLTRTATTVSPIIIGVAKLIIQDFTATLNNSLVSTRHPKQIRTTPAYCSVNLPGFREKTETLKLGKKNGIYFRKSLSQTSSLIRLDFPESPRFSFFFVVPSSHIRQLGTHTRGVVGRPEAPGSKALPHWTLNLRTHAHTVVHVNRQKRYRTKCESINTQHEFTSRSRDSD